MTHHSRGQSILFSILSSTLSSVGTLFKVKGVLTIPPILAATVGVLFAGLVMLPYLWMRGQLPKMSALIQASHPLMMLILCRPVVANVLFTIGLSMTTGIKAVFLTKMEPYLVIFWVWILDGKRPVGNHLLLLLVHIVGAVLLSTGGGAIEGAQWGDLIILISVLAAALSYRFAPRVTKVLTPLQTAAVSETCGGLITLPLALALSPLQFDAAQLQGWFYVGIHAILFYVLAIPLFYASLRGIEGWLASALRATGPLIAVPIAWLFFGERLTSTQIVGGTMVLVTSALISMTEKKKIPALVEDPE